MALFTRLIQFSGKIFDLNLVSKSQFVILTCAFSAFFLALSLIILRLFPEYSESGLSTQSVSELLTFCATIIILVATIMLYGRFFVEKSNPNAIHYPVIAVQTYVFANLIQLYYLGIYYIGTGMVFAGGPIIGMILLPTRVAMYGLATGAIITCLLFALTTLEYIAHAPILINADMAYTNAAWIVPAFSYFIPNLFIILFIAFSSLARWREREQRVAFLSCTDMLTDVANRRHLMDNFKNEVTTSSEQHQPISFLMVDLDHFKNINDSYGHQQGDDALREAAKALGHAVRKFDHVGRYGGEEFGIVLPGATEKEALEIAERCRHQVAATQLNDPSNATIKITVSIGVASTTGKDLEKEEIQEKIDTLLKQADEALYQAKNDGRNKVIHYNQSRTA